MRLSPHQRHALDYLRLQCGPYMPYADTERTFAALERRGLAVYLRVDDGWPRNGYMITDAGRALLETAT